jgi:hypothetical protein
VKVTGVPAQTAPAGFAVIDTLAGSAGFTVIVRGFEVAGLPVTHASDEVILTVTISLLLRAEVIYVGLLVPTTLPFKLHE